ncbi:hypothetical protein [Streptomyces prasinopilosus]|uniref:Uncharacterized protein n=1 Tax=Streptomyces prasinopilosus TaxID=67344 RepID=A0A1G6I8Z3_9ACTN|nr:hypothetical protein [Streptomyces prasinopilosus]SDC02921.1 hypothetical protein SAMN05216505_101123 [Streptomyces prasinopilosus]
MQYVLIALVPSVSVDQVIGEFVMLLLAQSQQYSGRLQGVEDFRRAPQQREGCPFSAVGL